MIKKLFVETIKSVASLIEGMRVTLKYFFKKPVTMQYPETKWPMPQRYRGVVSLIIDEKTGKHRCIACLSCVRICPNYSLSMEIGVNELKKRYPVKFDFEVGKCMFCGLCVEVCPVKDTLHLGTRKWKPGTAKMAALIAVVFAVFYIGAHVMGAWQTSVTDEAYRYHISNLNSAAYGHPGR